MRKLFMFLLVVFAFRQTHAQYVHTIKADSVLITNDSCTAELNLENSTKHIKGFLYNKGNGRTEFRQIAKLNDSMFVFGGDTLVVGGSAAWALKGNAHTIDSVNFIGTTDSVPLNFRVNNKKAGKIDLLLFNTFLGYTCGNANTTGSANAAYGFESFLNNTTGWANTAIGPYSLKANTTGTGNVALGHTALWLNTTGGANVAIGNSALIGNNTGGSNTAVGVQALAGLRTGSYNTVLGGYAAYPLNGSNNVIIGYYAANNMLSGNNNIIIGYNCNPPVATGSNQLVLGNIIYGTGVDGTNSTISNGKLGIKIKAPAYELDINGKLGVRTIDSTATAANMLYQDAATGEIKKAAIANKQSFAQTTTGTVNGTDSEATLITSGTGNLTIPASTLTVGKSYKITVHGVYSTDASNPANIILRLKLGSTTIASSSALFLGSGKSDVPFTLQATITCRSAGASGTVYTFGNVFRDGNVDPINNGTSASIINTTTSQTLDVTVQLNDSSSGNVVSAYIATLEALN